MWTSLYKFVARALGIVYYMSKCSSVFRPAIESKFAIHRTVTCFMTFLGIVPRNGSSFMISQVGLGLIDNGADPRSTLNLS